MGMSWSEEQYQEYLKKKGKAADITKKKRSKYNAKKTKVDGIIFHSKKESEYYFQLRLLLKAGAIKGFCMQPKFLLVEGNQENRAITYATDFIIFHNDSTFEIVDVKGLETEQWKRTFKQFKLKYPELELKVVHDV